MTIAPQEQTSAFPTNLMHSSEAWLVRPAPALVTDFLKQYFRVHSANPTIATLKLPRTLGAMTGKPSECRLFGPYFTAALLELDSSLHNTAEPSPGADPHARASLAEGRAVFSLLNAFRLPHSPEWRLDKTKLGEVSAHPLACRSAVVELGDLALKGLHEQYWGAERIANQAVQALSIAAIQEVSIPRQIGQQ